VADDFVKGLDDLLKELKEMSPNIEKESLRTGIFRAAQFMRDKVKDAAPISDGARPRGGRFRNLLPGDLKRSIKAKRRRGTKTEAAAGVSGNFYAKFVEFGHVLKGHRPNREILGHVPANPFIARTFEANKDGAIEEVRKGVLEQIKKRIAKLRSKMPKA
jgi:HK97 gp10 family phage protein